MYQAITGTGDGSAPVVNITFDYIDADHVKASVDGVEVAITWTGASQVTFDAVVASGAAWAVYRETPIDAPMVDFQDASVLTAGDLDLQDQQLRFHQEEVDVRVDAGNAASTSAVAAAASEAAAEASATSAAADAVATAADVASAAASEAAAAASAAAASTSQTAASNSATAAAASETAAESAATVAQTAVSLPSAAIPAASRAALALLDTANPGHLMEAGRAGMFVFDSSNLSAEVAADTAQGLYVPPASDPTGAGGAWVRVDAWPYLDPRWFGVVEGDASGANGAANSAALAEMFTALRARSVNPLGAYTGLDSIAFPKGYYEFDTTIDLTDGTFIIEGSSTGLPYGRATILKFPTGVTGIRTQQKDTSGAEVEDVVDHGAGSASIIRGLTLIGAFVDTEDEAHGIHLRTRAIVENCLINSFEGDGLYANASASGTPLGNANNTVIRDVRVESCRNGLSVEGNDVNIWNVSGLDVSLNRQWGVWDRSFLGNTYTAIHSANNGYPAGTAPGSTVSHGGERYAVNVGEEVGASTNAPSGTTADNQWWHWLATGGVVADFPAWLNGTTYRAGGAASTEGAVNRTVFVGSYAETGQGMAQFAEPTLVIGGMLAHHMRSGSGYMTGTGGITVGGDKLSIVNHVESRGINSSFGPISGAAADNLLYIESTNLSAGVNFRTWVSGTGTIIGYIKTAGAGGTAQLRINHSTTTVFRIADSAKARVTATEFRPEADNAMDLGLTGQRWKTIFGYTGDFTTQVKVGGVKVVGTQGAAVADAAAMTYAAPSGGTTVDTEGRASLAQLAADVTDLRAQLNTALARLRAHGLIAT